MLQDGETSLLYAVEGGHVKCVDQLFSTFGINVDTAFQTIFALDISETDPEDLEETDHDDPGETDTEDSEETDPDDLKATDTEDSEETDPEQEEDD